MKYRAWLNEWLAVSIKPRVKQSTYRKYGFIVQKQISPALGAFEMEELSVSILQKFTAGLSQRYSPNTMSGIVGVLKNSLRRAQKTGAVQFQFSDVLDLPSGREKKIECFTEAEQKRIETYILGRPLDKRFGIVLCFYTGLRIGELLALEWTDIDLDGGMLTISKSCRDQWGNGCHKEIDTPKTKNSERTIPIPRQIIPHLRAFRRATGGTGYLFKGLEGELSVRSYQRTFQLLLKKLKLPHRGFHAIRHTFATRALECGMDVKTLAEILGHGNPTVTLMRYAHSLMDHKCAMMNRVGRRLQ